MILETLIVGGVGAVLALLFVWFGKGRWPKWFIAAGAVAAMLAFMVSSDYRWFGRTQSALPMQFRLVESVKTRSVWRPWSMLAPVTDRFSVADMSQIRPNRAQEGLVQVDIYVFSRRADVQSVKMSVDCVERRRITTSDGNFDPKDAIVFAVCGPTRN